MEKKEMNIEIKETGKEMPQRLRDFFALEEKIVNLKNNNENELEKEAKKLLHWVATRKKQKTMIIATLKQWGIYQSIMVEEGKMEKCYKSSKTVQELKEVLEYIDSEVCNESTVIKGISVQSIKKDTYSIMITFK